MTYRIGIDAGSKTIKIVILDGLGSVIYTAYQRHHSNIRKALADMLHDLIWRCGDLTGSVVFTGSAGIALADTLHLPFVQEVIATTHAVQTKYPTADCVIELGGEDAKIIYLTDGLEQRMNATCAGGTGSFIDSIAHMLGIKTANMSTIAMGARHIYPIASRCAVFAQTDVRPLLNAGARKSDIAASVLDAVVRQTLGGLACGRPIRGTVVFLGGPLEYIPSLVFLFRRALGLTNKTGIKPPNAHLFPAYGVALMGHTLTKTQALSTLEDNEDDVSRVHANDKQPFNESSSCYVALSELEERVKTCPIVTDELARLPALLESNDLQNREAAQVGSSPALPATPQSNTQAQGKNTRPGEKEDAHVLPRRPIYEAEGPLYLGLDAGSTTMKYALIDSEGYLVLSDYQTLQGDSLDLARTMLQDMYRSLSQGRYGVVEIPKIAHATVTGYGEDLLCAGLGVDSGVVETAAHLRAAREFEPDVSFVLDIGGQDIKALWVRDGEVVDAILNEACSSGCGAFVAGVARMLRLDPTQFSKAALSAKNPLDLGTKCTVFMNSRVRHAQKVGASHEDIAAGVVYSVVQNALFRIIGRNKSSRLGEHIVVQGGVFQSDAVVRAFEKVVGKKVTRPYEAHLMGAIGAALIARERALDTDGGIPTSSERLHSTLLSLEQLEALDPKRTTAQCPGCQNACILSIIAFGGGRRFISGNRCKRAEDFIDGEGQVHDSVKDTSKNCKDAPQAGFLRGIPPNVVWFEQNKLAQFGDEDGFGARAACCVGILNTLHVYETLPFWHTLFAHLGFSVILPNDRRASAYRSKSAESIPSESVCQPAKLSHSRFFDLMYAGAQVVFMPRYDRGTRCPVSCAYADALWDTLASHADAPRLISPTLTAINPRKMALGDNNTEVLFDALAEMSAPYEKLTQDAFDEAVRAAQSAQEEFVGAIEKKTHEALNWIESDPKRHGIILAGRPYHVDPALLHNIDSVLTDLGFAVLSHAGLRRSKRKDDRTTHSYPLERLIASNDATCKCATCKSATYKNAYHEGLGQDGSAYPDATSSATSHTGTLHTDAAQNGANQGLRYQQPLWKPAKHLRILADVVLTHPKLDIVALRSFNCGYDAVTFDELSETFSRAHQPFTALKIDDIVDVAHIRIRLRTLAESIEARKRRERSRAQRSTTKTESFPTAFTSPEKSEVCNRAVQKQTDETTTLTQKECEQKAERSATLTFNIGEKELAVARSSVTPDLCFTAAALIARAINIARNDPSITTLRVPLVCKDCLVDALPGKVERVLGRALTIEWIEVDQVVKQSEALSHTSALRRPRIGIVGNALLCFDPFMNDGIVEQLHELDCEVVLPNPSYLETEDVRYIPQLELFERQGVDHVIYLQSFGCLKGHVQARGALHGLAKRFPTLPITVIDYDPESSALNRENRIRLAVESVRKKQSLSEGTVFRNRAFKCRSCFYTV